MAGHSLTRISRKNRGGGGGKERFLEECPFKKTVHGSPTWRENIITLGLVMVGGFKISGHGSLLMPPCNRPASGIHYEGSHHNSHLATRGQPRGEKVRVGTGTGERCLKNWPVARRGGISRSA